MGGEVFLYKDWKRLMKLMSQMEYQPLISTKIPMRKEHIDIIKDLNLNIRPIQFSLDTMIKDHLYKILNIKDPYYDDVLNMFSLLEENKVDYVIHSVISRFNDSIDDIKSLIDFFSDKHYLKKWMLDPAKCSMYNGREYSSYKTTIEKLNAVIECIDKSIANGQITYDVEKPKPIVNMNSISIEKKAKSFADRTMCTANLNALYILPDGKVTVCEELYWHPRFLLGDLTKQSIKEIWNSQKAKDLFFLKQESLQESSPCRTCEEFKECREYKHICWRETILAYGKDKWDYPDIRCPKAPPIERDISL